jgi:hypothetical protein
MTTPNLERASYIIAYWYYAAAPDELKALFTDKGVIILWVYNGNGIDIDMNAVPAKYWFTLYPNYDRVTLDARTSVYLLKSAI